LEKTPPVSLEKTPETKADEISEARRIALEAEKQRRIQVAALKQKSEAERIRKAEALKAAKLEEAKARISKSEVVRSAPIAAEPVEVVVVANEVAPPKAVVPVQTEKETLELARLERQKQLVAEKRQLQGDLNRLERSISEKESSLVSLKRKRDSARAAKNSRNNPATVKAELLRWKGLRGDATGGQLRKVAGEVASVSPKVRDTLNQLISHIKEHSELENNIKRNPSFSLRKKKLDLVALINSKGKQLEASVIGVVDTRISRLETESRNSRNNSSAAADEAQAAVNSAERELEKLLNQRKTVEKKLGELR